MPAEYFLYMDQQYGPYDPPTLGAFLREGRITGETLVFHDPETTEWTPASEVPSLQFLFERRVSRSRAAADENARKRTASIPRPEMIRKRPIILGGSKPPVGG